MKGMVCSVLILLSVLPVWGAELLPEHPPRTDSVDSLPASEPVLFPPQLPPENVLPAEPAAGVGVVGNAPFRERPYRMWPIYYHRKFAPDHERTIYGPLWLTEQDQNTEFNYPLWPFTGITRTAETIEKLDLVWPFIKYEQKDGHTSYDLLWPTTGFTHDVAPDREASSLFLAWPLVGYLHETKRSPADDAVIEEQTGYFPFYYNSEKGKESFRYVFPSFLAGSNPDKGTRFHTFLPFYFTSAQPAGSASYVLPTYLRIENPVRQLYSLLPFFHSDKTTAAGSKLFIFPSYFQFVSENDATVTGLLPFYLAMNNNSGTSYRYIFPTWLEQHKDRHDSTWFLPFYTSIEDSTSGSMIHNQTILWPFYYHRTDEGEGSTTTSLLLNLFYRKTSTSASEHYTSILWPFISFGESPQYKLLRIWPYAYEEQAEDNFRSHYFLWPLIGFGSGDRESTASVLPLYYHRTAPDRSFTLLLPFYLQKRTLESRFSILFPFWYQKVAGKDYENLFLNTLWSRKGERNSFAFFPLYYRSTAPEGSQTQILNTWWERSTERSSFAFFPVYFRYDTQTESGNLLLNTWWSGGERLERFVFFPLAWYHSPSPDDLDFIFFPLFGYDHKGNESSTFSFLWRLYYQHHDQNGSMAAFLWWLYRFEERPGFNRLMCWPFVDYERNTGATDEVFTSVLLHLLTYERNGERIRLKLFGLTLYES
ncbi:MAG: hypothetical protein PHI31_10850 [Desulfuromonadaceae bacterium]|nr:hypothetical protein [Desulfuromonadaceae bacterium]